MGTVLVFIVEVLLEHLSLHFQIETMDVLLFFDPLTAFELSLAQVIGM
jgi:hypothetical protein